MDGSKILKESLFAQTIFTSKSWKMKLEPKRQVVSSLFPFYILYIKLRHK